MIVCSCNVLSENRIREAAGAGADTTRKAYEVLGCKPQCCQCLPAVREVIRSERAKASESGFTMPQSLMPAAVGF